MEMLKELLNEIKHAKSINTKILNCFCNYNTKAEEIEYEKIEDDEEIEYEKIEDDEEIEQEDDEYDNDDLIISKQKELNKLFDDKTSNFYKTLKQINKYSQNITYINGKKELELYRTLFNYDITNMIRNNNTLHTYYSYINKYNDNSDYKIYATQAIHGKNGGVRNITLFINNHNYGNEIVKDIYDILTTKFNLQKLELKRNISK